MNDFISADESQTVLGFVKCEHMSELVNDLVLHDGDCHPNLGGITQGGMANHFPMTILALHGLGGSDSDIKRFVNAWPRHRALISQLNFHDSGVLNSKNWVDYLGQAQYLTEFKRVFLHELNKNDDPMVFVGFALDVMKDGLPMGLFHPLIRLSFSLYHGDKTLVADALAYMAIRYFDLYKQVPVAEDKSLKKLTASEVWKEIRSKARSLKLDSQFYGGSLHIGEVLCAEEQIQRLALPAGFQMSTQSLPLMMQQICECATKLYLTEPALTTLHGVTAAHALVEITQLAQKNDLDMSVYLSLWQRYWIWLTGLYVEKGCVENLPVLDIDQEMTLSTINWQDLSKAARKSTEVHLIKMVFTCMCLYQKLENNDLYKLAAINALRQNRALPQALTTLLN